MPTKQKIKCIVDFGMTVLLLLLMAYTLVGEAAHEWLGMAMLVLFLLHHALNFKWLKNLPRGRYSGFRILQTVLAALILLTMLGSMVSGILMSRYVFGFLHLRIGDWAQSMQDSFPHALELSQKGYNAFALIYRPGAQTACEDLARAIRFIFDHADELEVDTGCYSLWGGSAGARMAAWLGSYGAEAFGGGDLPRPGAVIMQYTGLSEYSESDPPTYACVGDRDGIANWQVMQARLEAMQQARIDTEFHVYSGLGHGFGLGTGTSAEGWINDAVAFWEKQMKK